MEANTALPQKVHRYLADVRRLWVGGCCHVIIVVYVSVTARTSGANLFLSHLHHVNPIHNRFYVSSINMFRRTLTTLPTQASSMLAVAARPGVVSSARFATPLMTRGNTKRTYHEKDMSRELSRHRILFMLTVQFTSRSLQQSSQCRINAERRQ